MEKLLILVALIATPALAGSLPINGVYGTPEACRYFAAGGPEAVEAADGGSDEENYSLVTPTKMIGFEWSCSLNESATEGVTATCGESGSSFTSKASIELDGEVLIVGEPFTRVELHPCPTDENATM